MKKTILFVLISVIATSCGSLDELLELNVNNDLIEVVDINVPQTQGSAVAYDHTEVIDLTTGSFAEYAGKISAIKINTLTYKFKDFSGNHLGEIKTGTLKFDDIVIATQTNFNISQAAENATVFNITDNTVLSQIETSLVNNPSVTLKLLGTVLSDEGDMDFTVEVFMNMTATIND